MMETNAWLCIYLFIYLHLRHSYLKANRSGSPHTVWRNPVRARSCVKLSNRPDVYCTWATSQRDINEISPGRDRNQLSFDKLDDQRVLYIM